MFGILNMINNVWGKKLRLFIGFAELGKTLQKKDGGYELPKLFNRVKG